MSTTTSLQDVLAAFSAGAGTVDEIAARTGIDTELVRVALDQLVSLQLITSDTLANSVCPPGGCGACGSEPDCLAQRRGGLVTLRLVAAPPG